MKYELWGLHPASLIDTFETEADALEEVLGLLDAGWGAEDLSLGRVNGGTGSVVAEGLPLAHLARSAAPGPRPLSA
jgi:hypothetical protein